eukprot:TRINITY_DN9289_c0_g9_i1.p1 TRINITY_DN9289_c0_g9~~TRINITY_DN9289_c0_g9_i1.p1  ORF type:complete len:298 (-),score=24.59 TRINITY_DN9289_c0_g9_i1:275-1168(-)
MAASIFHHLFCIFFIHFFQFALASSPICPSHSFVFLDDLQSQCPLSISPSPPTQVDGESLDRALSSSQSNMYTSVLFYASWCPFSRSILPTFNVLSSMFPQITHLTIEESSVMPSVFSRYGVHSLPSILMVNQTSKVPYYGLKDLGSLTLFYKRITGLEPFAFFSMDQPSSFGSEKSQNLWEGHPREILKREPYLVFSILFLCLKGFLYFFPDMLVRLKALWVSYVWPLNLGIFGETGQLLERVLHAIDVKRVHNKLRFCKTGNFQKGAENARVWASSLASVSLGESSSTRSSALDS